MKQLLKYIISSLCLLYLGSTIASNNDTINIRQLILKRMSFHSELEKQVFKAFDSTGNISMIDLMLASDKYISLQEFNKTKAELDSFIRQLDVETRNLSPTNKIKIVFQRTHKRYFKKYDLEVLTNDLFRSGYYNCVTGTCLFAHILNQLNIPYIIKETPNHVFIIAYPDNEKIHVESTDPRQGFLKPSRVNMNQFLYYLVDNKVITQGELDSNGIENTFEKYYYSRINIKYPELAGLQYYNMALISIELGRLEAAATFMEKAFFLYNSDRTRILLKNIYEACMYEDHFYADPTRIEFFLKYYALVPPAFKIKYMEMAFNKVRHDLLNDKGDPILFDRYYDSLKQNLSYDTAVFTRIKWQYNFERGKTALLQGDYQNAIKYINAASFLQPNNREITMAVELAITRQLATMDSPEYRINKLNEITRTYNHMKAYTSVKLMYTYNYLELALRSLRERQLSHGSYFMDQFESVREIKGLETGKITEAYLLTANLYEQNGDVAKARKYLEHGLTILPNNVVLKEEYNRIRRK